MALQLLALAVIAAHISAIPAPTHNYTRYLKNVF